MLTSYFQINFDNAIHIWGTVSAEKCDTYDKNSAHKERFPSTTAH